MFSNNNCFASLALPASGWPLWISGPAIQRGNRTRAYQDLTLSFHRIIACHLAGFLANTAPFTLVWARNPYYPLGPVRFWLHTKNFGKLISCFHAGLCLGLAVCLRSTSIDALRSSLDGHKPLSRTEHSSPKLLPYLFPVRSLFDSFPFLMWATSFAADQDKGRRAQ